MVHVDLGPELKIKAASNLYKMAGLVTGCVWPGIFPLYSPHGIRTSDIPGGGDSFIFCVAKEWQRNIFGSNFSECRVLFQIKNLHKRSDWWDKFGSNHSWQSPLHEILKHTTDISLLSPSACCFAQLCARYTVANPGEMKALVLMWIWFLMGTIWPRSGAHTSRPRRQMVVVTRGLKQVSLASAVNASGVIASSGTPNLLAPHLQAPYNSAVNSSGVKASSGAPIWLAPQKLMGDMHFCTFFLCTTFAGTIQQLCELYIWCKGFIMEHPSYWHSKNWWVMCNAKTYTWVPHLQAPYIGSVNWSGV